MERKRLLKILFSDKTFIHVVIFFIVILCFQVFLLFKTQFIAWPEMLLWPYLSKLGYQYYIDIVAVYPPLLLRILEIATAYVDWNIVSLKLITWLVLITTGIITYWVTYKLTGLHAKSLLTLFIYVLWQVRYEGNGLWFDHVLAPLVLLTFYLLYVRRIGLAAVFFSLALLTKQTAAYLFIPIILLIGLNSKLLKYIAYVALFFLSGIFILVPYSIIPIFYENVVIFGLTYLPRHPQQIKYPSLKLLILFSLPFVSSYLTWFLLRVKKTTLPFSIRKKITGIVRGINTRASEQKVMHHLIFWSIFSSLGVFPRFELFHIQPALPFLAIIFTLSLFSLFLNSDNRVSMFSKSVAIIFTILNALSFSYFFLKRIDQPPRFLDSEVATVSNDVKRIVGDESFYTYGTWDHIYVLSQTKPAVKLVFPTVQWFFEYPGFQERTVESLQDDMPMYILRGVNEYKPEIIDNFIENKYSLKKNYFLKNQQMELYALED